MIEDSVVQEVRAARDAYARSLGYDVRAMVADLRARDDCGDWPVVRLAPRHSSKPATPPGGGMATNSQFDFYEKVIVNSANPALSEINNELAAILGRAYGDDGRWSYAVSIYRTGLCWSCTEDDLRTTGLFDRRETFFDGSSVRVNQQGEVLGWNLSQGSGASDDE